MNVHTVEILAFSYHKISRKKTTMKRMKSQSLLTSMSYVEIDSHSTPKCFKIGQSTGRCGQDKYTDKKTMKVIAKMRRRKKRANIFKI